MKKINPFVLVKQFFYSDSEHDANGEVTSHGDINWWVDEDYLGDFKETFDDQLKSGDIVLIDERTIKGVEYNKQLIGSPYDDYQGHFVDEECPECEHLLVFPDCMKHDDDDKDFQRVQPTGEERHCSDADCNYANEDYMAYENSEDDYWSWAANQPDLPQFREPGQTAEEFIEKYKFGDVKDPDECIVCKRMVPITDFYINKMGAHIKRDHDCKNSGNPSHYRPLGKEADKWNKILF